MKHASLFTGIGGFDLAAKWMGWQNVFQVEIDGWCNDQLSKLFDNTFKAKDVRDVTIDNYGNLLSLNGTDVLTMGQPKSSKYDYALDLYNSGASIAECAEFYEISRQAMHKILERRGCVFRCNVKFGADNHFYRGCYPDRTKKDRAHDLVEKAIKRGVLVNPQICSCCGSSKTMKDGRTAIQAHHDDYDKPLEVRWLCQNCHHEWHKHNKPLNEIDTEKTNEPSAATDVVS